MNTDQWLGVELRHLAALEAVARTGSFGRAARELGYTQSAVSQQIAQLERIIGHRLFHRPGGPRRVEPTEAGLLLLRHADAIVAQIDAARADMAALAEGAAGTLRAVRFDLGRLEVTSDPVPVVEKVTMSVTTGTANFALSHNGTLVYVPGGDSLYALDANAAEDWNARR